MAGRVISRHSISSRNRPPREVRGPFRPIATNVPGVSICELSGDPTLIQASQLPHRHVHPLRRGHLPCHDVPSRHAGEPARLRPGQDAQPAQRQQLRAPLQLHREGRAGDPRHPADGVPLLRPLGPPLHEPGHLRADHPGRRDPRRLHALPAAQHRHPDRLLRREARWASSCRTPSPWRSSTPSPA